MKQNNRIIDLKNQILKEVFFDDTMDNTIKDAFINLVILEYFSTFTFANANIAILDAMKNRTTDMIDKYSQTKKKEYWEYKDSNSEVEEYMKQNMFDCIFKDDMFGKTITKSATIKHKSIFVDWYGDLTRDKLNKCLIYTINILDRFVYLLEQCSNDFLDSILPYYISKLYAPRISRKNNDFNIEFSCFTERYIGLHIEGKINKDISEDSITDDEAIKTIIVNRRELLKLLKKSTQPLAVDKDRKNKNKIHPKMPYVSCALYHSIIFARLITILYSCNTMLCCYLHACENVLFETYYDLLPPLSYETIAYSLIEKQEYSHTQVIDYITEKREMILNYLQRIIVNDYLPDFLEFDPYYDELRRIMVLFTARNNIDNAANDSECTANDVDYDTYDVDGSVGFSYHQIKDLLLKDADIRQYTNKETKVKRNLEEKLYTKIQLKKEFKTKWKGGNFPLSHLK